jgi:alkanesulfonate monooxygenase SsuD/methylene tetrahydromethanopterin reductase-like flavin-dependent oxidoreductase (luciferase family)
MDFGVNFFPVFSTREKTTASYFAESLRLAHLADRLGFAHVRTVEHYGSDYGGSSPNPLLFLAAASQVTGTARLIVGCSVPAFTHPIHLASDIRMLDALSGGRLEVGFARGFLPHEYDLFGIDVDQSSTRFAEGCEQVRLLLSKDGVSHDGTYHRLTNVTITPEATQRPYPPLWIAAVATRSSFTRAGQLGYDLMTLPHSRESLRDLIAMYREARTSAGHEGQGRVMIAFHMLVAETDAEARKLARQPLERYTASLIRAMAPWKDRQSADYAPYREVLRSMENDSPDEQIRRGSAWVGSPATIRETVESYHASVGGFDEASFQVLFDTVEEAAAARTLTLFAESVANHARSL